MNAGLVLLAGSGVLRAQQKDDSAAWLRFIGLELRQLRIELLEFRLAAEEERASRLDRELSDVRTELLQARGEERAHRQYVEELDRQAEVPELDAQSRQTLQALKAELSGGGSEKLRFVQTALTSREGESSERLRLAKARMQALSERLKALTTAQ